MSHPKASPATTEAHGQSREGLEDNSPRKVLNADLALVLCARAWGLPDQPAAIDHGQAAAVQPILARSPWAWLEPSWRDRTQSAWETARRAESPVQAIHLLRDSHRFQCRADLVQLHSSWCARALQDESPAVRRLLASHTPRALPAWAGETGDRDPDSEVTSWVLALWTERLVGGEPVGHDEPLVIIALAGFSNLERYRLCQTVGLAKMILAAGLELLAAGAPAVQARSLWLGERLKSVDARAQEWARREVQALAGAEFSPRRQLALMGLTTLARLLADCDPFRTRWTLQHLPYPIAKRIRSLMPSPQKRSIGVSSLESLLLKTAWERLSLEKRITRKHPDRAARERDVY
jgi:hypothetical protein